MNKKQAVETLRAIWDKYYETICRRFDPVDVVRLLEVIAALEKEVKA